MDTDTAQGYVPAARQVEVAVLNAIVNLELKPGTRVSEQELAERYGTSRQPVREAFIALAGKGLLTILPQRGTFVTKLSIDKMLQARFVREAIEKAIVRAACQDFDPATRELIEDLLAAQRKAAAANEHVAFQSRDQQFHAALTTGVGCPLAWMAIRDVKVHMDRICSLTLSSSSAMQALVRDHEAIMAAIDRHDPDGAERAVQHHLTEIVRALPQTEAEYPDLFELKAPELAAADATRSAAVAL